MPVPAARSLLYCSVVLMITMPCCTLLRLPPVVPVPPELGMGTAVLGSGTGAPLLGCADGTAVELAAGW